MNSGKESDRLRSFIMLNAAWIAVQLTFFTFLTGGMLIAQSNSGTSSAVVLYDASIGTDPDQQGWIFLSSAFDDSEAVRYTREGVHVFDTMANLSESAGYFGNEHPGISALNRQVGFSVRFELKIIKEQHQSNHRGGFSIIVLSDDLFGVEIVFWEEKVWVYNTSFEMDEHIGFSTTERIISYSIEVLKNQYVIYADGTEILAGPLRNYSAAGIPYNIPDFIFFGDDTSSAGAKVHLSEIEFLQPFQSEPFLEDNVLHQNAPNPFRDQTVIRYQLKESGTVRLDLFDLNGRHLYTLAEGHHQAGEHEVTLSGSELSGGLYLYRLRVNGESHAKKLLRIK
jgi:hypothetical protein